MEIQIKKKNCLVSGATGQAARYLIELLLAEGHKVFGLIRRTSNPNTERIAHLLKDITLLSGDLTDESSLISAVDKSEPDIVFNLAAQSVVPTSWVQPELTANVTGLGVLRLLNAIKMVNPKIRFVQSASSEQFGKVQEIPQSETTPFYPRSPYAVAKCFAYWTVVNFRESYGIFASNALNFNFESFFRSTEFVTKKITDGVCKIVRGETAELRLGNIKAKRDWGFVGDTVRAMYLISQHDKPDDFVVATGETHSVEEFLEIAFGYFNLDYKKYVVIDQELIRPAEVDLLLGDATKIRTTLGWKPMVKFKELVSMMIEHELKPVKKI